MLQILYCLGSPEHGPPTGFLVMQVRVLTEAPLPQLREQTDQPLHAAHSFLKCSCRRARARRPDDTSPDGCHAETQELCGDDRQTGATSSRTKVRAWHRVSFLGGSEGDMVDPCGLDSGVLHSLSGAVLFPHHGVERRGSDAQCIPAAGSDTRLSHATPSISPPSLPSLPLSWVLLFFCFLRETLKGVSQLHSSSIQTDVFSSQNASVLSFGTRKVFLKKTHLLLVQKKVFSDTKCLFLLRVKAASSDPHEDYTLFQTETSQVVLEVGSLVQCLRLQAGDLCSVLPGYKDTPVSR